MRSKGAANKKRWNEGLGVGHFSTEGEIFLRKNLSVFFSGISDESTRVRGSTPGFKQSSRLKAVRPPQTTHTQVFEHYPKRT
ncbi:hypothetical protein VNO77_34752 [Canavalia gladiata]|uniref:Uncharacterized protein n=1 Tax=Canavalia gladiata TaxID=3824 RepID=A0AAN9PYQ2_CANGL